MSHGIRDDRGQIAKPVLVIFTVMAVSFAGYFGSRQVTHDGIHQAMALIFGTTYFLCWISPDCPCRPRWTAGACCP